MVRPCWLTSDSSLMLPSLAGPENVSSLSQLMRPRRVQQEQAARKRTLFGEAAETERSMPLLTVLFLTLLFFGAAPRRIT
jgi:hypothetical protein